MNMHILDWTIIALLMAGLAFIVLGSRKYMRGVSDFLAAGRCGGRYLLCIGEGIAGLGAITIIAFWQMYYKGGFTSVWWTLPQWPTLFILAMSGWVLYRYRQTRALTMAQFLEMRYSKRFRIYTGLIAFLAGVINYGVFPGINAGFFIYFCGLPEHFMVAGFSVDTFPVVMAILLGTALFFTFTGGQIAIMLANFLQGVFCMVVLVSCALVVAYKIGWTHVTEAMQMAPENQSWINPFKISDTKGFDPWFFIIQYFIWVYSWKAWQGTAAYNSSAKSPHEARMAQILGTWRYFSQEMLIPIFAIAALVVLHHVDFAGMAADVQQNLQNFTTDEQQSRMAVPLVLSKLLPVGLMGALAAVMLAAAVSTDQSYLHSWGSMFIQDVVMPFRKKPFSPKLHIWILRGSICAVAVFAFVFSMHFRLPDYIRMFFALTGAIYLGGAGACIIGGLYTRKGTAAAAFATMTTGMVLGLGGVIAQQIVIADQQAGGWMAWLQTQLYMVNPVRWVIEKVGNLDGQRLTFFNALCCISVYAVVSLLTGKWTFKLDRLGTRTAAVLTWLVGIGLGLLGVISKKIMDTDAQLDGWMASVQSFLYRSESLKKAIETIGHLGWPWMVLIIAGACLIVYALVSLVSGRQGFNLDRMLHRGEYAVKDDVVRGDVIEGPRLYRWLGIGESFTRTDRWIYLSSVAWVLLWGVVFFVGLIWNYLSEDGIADSSWMTFWGYMVVMSLVLGLVTTVWFLIGGIANVKEMFYLLRTREQDSSDDGMVYSEESET